MSPTANAAGLFHAAIDDFPDGKMMPKKVANTNAVNKNPNCVGDNVSPELHWTNVPDGTKSLVLLMTDPGRPWRRRRHVIGSRTAFRRR